MVMVPCMFSPLHRTLINLPKQSTMWRYNIILSRYLLTTKIYQSTSTVQSNHNIVESVGSMDTDMRILIPITAILPPTPTPAPTSSISASAYTLFFIQYTPEGTMIR